MNLIVIGIVWTTFAAGLQTAGGEPAQETQSVEQTVRAALAELTQLEALPERPLPRSALLSVNDKIISIETRDPGNVWLDYLYGRSFILIGRGGDAIDRLRSFVNTREGRNEWLAFRMLGDLFVDQFHNLAQSYYKKGAELNPSEPSILYGLSRCAYQSGNNEEAIRLARQAVQSAGTPRVSHLAHLARVLAANQQWGEADGAAMSAVDRAKALANEAPGVRAGTEAVLASYDSLISILRSKFTATGAAPEDYLRMARYLDERADVARQLARFDTLDILQSGVDAAKPDATPALLEQYAVTLAEVGRKDDAVKAFGDLLARDPQNPTAKEWLIRLSAPASSDATP